MQGARICREKPALDGLIDARAYVTLAPLLQIPQCLAWPQADQQPT
jgi:hypothetical protein